jgi:polyphosphate glucokinase
MNANARTGQTKQMTLALDIGGSHLKAAILDESGAMSSSPVRVETPKPATPEAIVATLMHVTQRLGQFNRVSIGFPGVVRTNFILTAPNLGPRPDVISGSGRS